MQNNEKYPKEFSREKFPFVLGLVGAIFNLLMTAFITYFALGGAWVNGYVFEFGNMGIVIAIMAIISGIVGIVGASISFYSEVAGSILMLIGVVEYSVAAIMTGLMWLVPYLLIGSVGALLLLVSSIFTIIEGIKKYQEKDEAYYNYSNKTKTTY